MLFETIAFYTEQKRNNRIYRAEKGEHERTLYDEKKCLGTLYYLFERIVEDSSFLLDERFIIVIIIAVLQLHKRQIIITSKSKDT